VTDQPDDMPPYVYIEEAERLLREANNEVSENMLIQTGESKTDVLLAAIANVLVAMAKMQGRGRVG
jgi:hypothetical protein